LENQLIPRSVVRKLQMAKGLPAANQKLACFMIPNEEKFDLLYEHDIPRLYEAYADAGKIGN
jgi:hypothetical protein